MGPLLSQPALYQRIEDGLLLWYRGSESNVLICISSSQRRAARQIIPLTPRSSSCRIRDLGKDSKISSPHTHAGWRLLQRYRPLATANCQPPARASPAHDAQLLLRLDGVVRAPQVQIYQTPMSTVLAPASRWLATRARKPSPSRGGRRSVRGSPAVASGYDAMAWREFAQQLPRRAVWSACRLASQPFRLGR